MTLAEAIEDIGCFGTLIFVAIALALASAAVIAFGFLFRIGWNLLG